MKVGQECPTYSLDFCNALAMNQQEDRTDNMSSEPSLYRSCQSRPFQIPLCWALLIAFDLCLMALAMAQESQPGPIIIPVQAGDVAIPGPAEVAQNSIRFEAIDVFLDSGNLPLAAWQLELRSHTQDVEIVGIEGGEHSAFKEPPYYDPRAMNNNRVILGAFNTGSDDQLPSGRSRVARIHVQITGPGERLWHTELTTSAASDGRNIPAELSIAKAQG
jgi:hypothetical protein